MTIEEIFNQIARHMVKGLMIHSQMADYFNFLGLKGYKECHEYHYYEENLNYKRIVNYYIEHYNKLLMDLPFENPHIIPEGWLKYNRFDATSSVKQTGVQSGFDRWIEWEKETKDFLQKMFQELMSLGEIACAIELERYIKDVDKELAEAQAESLNLKSIDYNMSDIIMMQDDIHTKYKKKMKDLKV